MKRYFKNSAEYKWTISKFIEYDTETKESFLHFINNCEPVNYSEFITLEGLLKNVEEGKMIEIKNPFKKLRIG